jgi:cytidine deaminase
MSENFKKLSITAEFEVYESEKDLSAGENLLLQKAKNVLKNAYAPYSNFLVGAAILLENGEIVIGNNQENAAYPSGLCAERVAIFHASAVHSDSAVKTIAISCKSLNTIIEGPVTPCGACRQVIAEYETKFNQPIRIIMQGEKGNVYAANGIESLLPLMFNRKYLK